MSRAYWIPRPKLGDIVECSFPQQVGVPGPKNRPALVLQVEEAGDDPTGSVVVVAYATSQNTSTVYPGEFVIEASARTGLTKATKFDLVNHHRLPFDDSWFAPAPGNTPGTRAAVALTFKTRAVSKDSRSRQLVAASRDTPQSRSRGSDAAESPEMAKNRETESTAHPSHGHETAARRAPLRPQAA
ncbi:type II toxin-antitoxin system PemK/MazF family toxin [Variovorax flavidus]|uniref:type II toxin-antitoxin system PemK/MazF family toxin n=1 Tax=Variovorax flavidus TaxID=3053501 RepID=UPI0033654F00